MRVRRKGSRQPKQKKREGQREKHAAVRAAGLSHFLEELGEVIAIGACNTSRQRGGRGRCGGGGRGRCGGGGRGKRQLSRTNPADVSLPPSVPQSHTNLEVLNTTLHANSKTRVSLE